jgi:hypothetical protein
VAAGGSSVPAFPFPAFAAPARVVDCGLPVLRSDANSAVEVVDTLVSVAPVPLPAGEVAFRRTLVQRRPLNVVTEDDIRTSTLRDA